MVLYGTKLYRAGKIFKENSKSRAVIGISGCSSGTFPGTGIKVIIQNDKILYKKVKKRIVISLFFCYSKLINWVQNGEVFAVAARFGEAQKRRRL